MRFGRQGGVAHQLGGESKNAVLLNGVGYGGDSNDASYDAFNHNFPNLMLVGRCAALADGDGGVRRSLGGAIEFSIRRATGTLSRISTMPSQAPSRRTWLH
jgi:hypothetical protein